MSLRAGLIVAFVLGLVFALPLAFMARGDGIWSGGGVIGNDGIATGKAIGANGIGGISAVSASRGGGGCAGVLDLSTGCAQAMAYGGLF
jgi:hypothetical protein